MYHEKAIKEWEAKMSDYTNMVVKTKKEKEKEDPEAEKEEE